MAKQTIHDNHGFIVMAAPGSHVNIIVLDKKKD